MSRWRGWHAPWNECWLDVLGTGTTTPNDLDSHGTHCTGTMCGLAPGDTIGIAPAAEWIACNAIDQSVGSAFDQDIIDSFEWMTDPDGDPLTLDDVPDVVQNSWGVREAFGYLDCDSRWWDVIDACEAAGPVCIFAAGNEGPTPATIRSPADRATTLTNAFSVGATSHDAPFDIAAFSSRGPAGTDCGPPENEIKPEVCAPGVDVVSALPGGGYGAKTGTSMAAPHVCGTVALMRAANPDADAITIKQILMNTAVDLGVAGEDNSYGHGLIDAYAAVVQVAGGLGHVRGTVRRTSTDAPVADIAVTVDGAPQSTTTGDDGSYLLPLFPGAHTLHFEGFGFTPATGIVTIADGDTAVVDVHIDGLPVVNLHGTVTLPSGEPAAGAQIDVVGVPGTAVLTDPSGMYQLSLPAAPSYELEVLAGNAGELRQRVPVTPEVGVELHLQPRHGDNFESGALADSVWTLSGDADWFVQSDVVHAGSFALGSPSVNNGGSAQAQATVTCGAGQVTFERLISSEAGHDILTFEVDGDRIWMFSGEFGWSTWAVDVAAGTHTFTWRYEKDASGSFGLDAAYVDDFCFPSPDAPQPYLVAAPDTVQAEISGDGRRIVSAYLVDEGTADLAWTLTQPASWLHVLPESGLVATADFQELRFTFDSTGLPPGWYVTQVVIASDDTLRPALPIDVRLNVTSPLTGIADLPPAARLHGAAPNPFNGSTVLRFDVPVAGRVTLAVYDVRGRLVRSLVDGPWPAGPGNVRWDGRDDDGQAVASGTYFARLCCGATTTVKGLSQVK